MVLESGEVLYDEETLYDEEGVIRMAQCTPAYKDIGRDWTYRMTWKYGWDW